jgi:hypothetical protein
MVFFENKFVILMIYSRWILKDRCRIKHMMITTMLTSTPTKEKKKNSSPSKQNRSTVPGTLKVISHLRLVFNCMFFFL